MVTLTRIYTRGGDSGQTSLGRGERVAKHDPRVEAYGTVDEANSVIGLARSAIARTPLGVPHHAQADAMLARIQNDLFDLGADLCTPEGEAKRGEQALRIVASQVERLEHEIDAMNAELEPLKSFILPGGSEAAAWLHLARTVARRAERRMTAARRRAADQPRGDQVHQPPVRPSVRAGAAAERQRRQRRALGARRRPLTEVRDAALADHAEWHRMWLANCAHYGVSIPAAENRELWRRIMDPEYPIGHWCAVHPLAKARWSALQTMCFIRTHSAAGWSAILKTCGSSLRLAAPDGGESSSMALVARGRDRGWRRIYWHTEADNAAARRLYDRVSRLTNYVRYDITLP